MQVSAEHSVPHAGGAQLPGVRSHGGLSERELVLSNTHQRSNRWQSFWVIRGERYYLGVMTDPGGIPENDTWRSSAQGLCSAPDLESAVGSECAVRSRCECCQHCCYASYLVIMRCQAAPAATARAEEVHWRTPILPEGAEVTLRRNCQDSLVDDGNRIGGLRFTSYYCVHLQ